MNWRENILLAPEGGEGGDSGDSGGGGSSQGQDGTLLGGGSQATPAQQGQPAPDFSFLPQDIRSNPSMANLLKASSMNEFATNLSKSFIGAQQQVGDAKPQADWTPEKRAEWRQGLPGAVKEAGEYSGGDLEAKATNKELIGKVKETLHKYGVEKDQGDGFLSDMLGHFSEIEAGQPKQMFDMPKDQIRQGLEKEWGMETSRNLELVSVASKALFEMEGGDELHSLLFNSGIGNHPTLLRFMKTIGSKMAEEQLGSDKMIDGSGSFNVQRSAEQERERLKGDPEFIQTIVDRNNGKFSQANYDRWRRVNNMASGLSADF